MRWIPGKIDGALWRLLGLVVLLVLVIAVSVVALSGYTLRRDSPYVVATPAPMTSGPTATTPSSSPSAAASSSTPTSSPRASRTPSASSTPSTQPVAVFLGDSYTSGAGIGGSPWPTLVSKEMGWKLVNLAQGGTGYNATSSGGLCGRAFCPNYGGMVDDVVAAHPDVVVVSGGRNDGDVYPTKVNTLFATLREQLPHAKIYAVTPWWDSSQPPSWILQKGTTVRAAVTSVGGTYLGTDQPLLGRSDLLYPNSVMPNPSGSQALADAVIRELKS